MRRGELSPRGRAPGTRRRGQRGAVRLPTPEGPVFANLRPDGARAAPDSAAFLIAAGREAERPLESPALPSPRSRSKCVV